MFRKFFPFFKSHMDKIVLVWVLDSVSMLLGLAAPLMTKLTIDYAYLGRDMEIFHVVIIVGLLLMIMELYLGFMRDYLGTRTENLIKLDFSRKLYFHLLRLPYSFFHEHTSGELTFRMESDTSGLVSLFLHELPGFLLTLLRVIFLMAICFYMNWGATLIIIGVVPLIYFQAHFFGKKYRRIQARSLDRAQDTSSNLQETISNIALVKTQGTERGELANFLRNKIRYLKTTVREEILSFFQEMTSGGLNQVVFLGFTYYTGYMVIKGFMTLGEVIALTMYILQLFGILRGIGGHYQGLLTSLVHIDRLNEILDSEVEWSNGNGAGRVVSFHGAEGHLSIRNLNFAYRGGSEIIRNLFMEIPAGALVGIAGKSGAGKSTLVSLLLRFYEPDAGGVFIDGKNIREMDIRSHRRRISISSQEPILWNRSIYENIRYGAGTREKEEIFDSARLADIHPFIESLSEGYETIVGEGGARLSRGQKQRIALARCFLKRKSIIILDESTASLDPESERKIILAIRGLNPKPTVLIVTHNLENLLYCEKVFFLEDGSVAVSGSPEELIETDQAFRSLFLKHEEAGRMS